jgi:hypothetical protein
VALGRVSGSGGAGEKRTLCEAAQDAAARNSPAAPALAAQCRASDLRSFPELARRGELLATEDPLAFALRSQQPMGAARTGFDIGMAVTDGQTANGPGKQRIHDALGAVEQSGFEAALNFSMERNRNGELAARGAAVALSDPAVAKAQGVEVNVFYRLGFDIASGIFGDPALGALGTPVAGPTELAVRNALSPSAQRGFSASMAFHLSRAKP